MPKSPDAFRTISEVADWLDIQAHVLRFWESKFTQVKPIKRAGGRRYYRPNDMLLLGGIKKLLHDDGLTIKGVQKILREEGMNHVAALSMPLDELTMSQMAPTPTKQDIPAAPMVVDAEPETGVVLPFGTAQATDKNIKKAPQDTEVTWKMEEAEPSSPVETPARDKADADMSADAQTVAQIDEAAASTEEGAPELSTDPEPPQEQPFEAEAAPETKSAISPQSPEDTPPDTSPAPAEPDPVEPELTADAESKEEAEKQPAEQTVEEIPETDKPPEIEPSDPGLSPLPGFLKHAQTADEDSAAEATEEPAPEPEAGPDEPEAAPTEPEAEPEPEPLRARDIGMPEITPEGAIEAKPGALAAVGRVRQLSPAQVAAIRPLVAQLVALRDSIASQRPPVAKD